jgi:hypothetical protein
MDDAFFEDAFSKIAMRKETKEIKKEEIRQDLEIEFYDDNPEIQAKIAEHKNKFQSKKITCFRDLLDDVPRAINDTSEFPFTIRHEREEKRLLDESRIVLLLKHVMIDFPLLQPQEIVWETIEMPDIEPITTIEDYKELQKLERESGQHIIFKKCEMERKPEYHMINGVKTYYVEDLQPFARVYKPHRIGSVQVRVPKLLREFHIAFCEHAVFGRGHFVVTYDSSDPFRCESFSTVGELKQQLTDLLWKWQTIEGRNLRKQSLAVEPLVKNLEESSSINTIELARFHWDVYV